MGIVIGDCGEVALSPDFGDCDVVIGQALCSLRSPKS